MYTISGYDASMWDGWYSINRYQATNYDSGWISYGHDPVEEGNYLWIFTGPGQGFKTVVGVAFIDFWVMMYDPQFGPFMYTLPDPVECDPHSQGVVIPQ
jgi:hypothetical protein